MRTDLGPIRSLAFGGGRFVIVGPEGHRSSSQDGKTWEKANGDEKELFRWVIWTGKEFLCGARKIYSSKDGKSWKLTNLKFRGSPKWTDGTRYINTSWPGRMYFSPDGKTWAESPKMTANGINKVVRGIGK